MTGSRRARSRKEENWEGLHTQFGKTMVVWSTKRWREERTRCQEEDKEEEQRRAIGDRKRAGIPKREDGWKLREFR